MSKILEIATNVSTPLMLAGFLAGAFFLILQQILKKDLFPKLKTSTPIIQLIINRLFVLALVALILGFVGFVLPLSSSVVPDDENTSESPPIEPGPTMDQDRPSSSVIASEPTPAPPKPTTRTLSVMGDDFCEIEGIKFRPFPEQRTDEPRRRGKIGLLVGGAMTVEGQKGATVGAYPRHANMEWLTGKFPGGSLYGVFMAQGESFQAETTNAVVTVRLITMPALKTLRELRPDLVAENERLKKEKQKNASVVLHDLSASYVVGEAKYGILVQKK